MEPMGHTSYTEVDHDNKLGLTDPEAINRAELEGIARAQHFLFSLSPEHPITAELIRRIHYEAFHHLYHWAGQYRRVSVVVGGFEPPPPAQVPLLMYQLEKNLELRLPYAARGLKELVEVIAEIHHRLTFIHPFRNGNGRTARLVSDLISLRCGGPPVVLYVREGDLRRAYIEALRQADQGRMEPLQRLIRAAIERQADRYRELVG
ncbi:MAG: Fic family protein [Bacteroidetes bacterium]|nr:Fic family protein [Rhodothermia bacterium]MCX7907007.1 Fic family protein [Bacteroidota bacterium]MDW8285417.1 Fic family protein [Bacteroidota bacterium]